MATTYIPRTATKPSRTGGDAHEIGYLENSADPSERINFSCNCKAGRNGRECWVVKELKAEPERKATVQTALMLESYSKLGGAA